MCDGTGWMNERYIDVDLTTADRCPGCPECDEEKAEQLAEYYALCELDEMREAVPLWAGEVVVDAPRRPILPELPADFKFIEIERTA